MFNEIFDVSVIYDERTVQPAQFRNLLTLTLIHGWSQRMYRSLIGLESQPVRERVRVVRLRRNYD